jgi:hypothetical protein
MGRGPLLQRQLTCRGRLSRPGPKTRSTNSVLAILSDSYPQLEGRLATCYAPVRHFTQGPKSPISCDLHVLSPPLTFALSQDQTLQFFKTVELDRPAFMARRIVRTLHCIKPANFLRYSVFRDRRGPDSTYDLEPWSRVIYSDFLLGQEKVYDFETFLLPICPWLRFWPSPGVL